MREERRRKGWVSWLVREGRKCEEGGRRRKRGKDSKTFENILPELRMRHFSFCIFSKNQESDIQDSLLLPINTVTTVCSF